jgi:hypothetical protein
MQIFLIELALLKPRRFGETSDFGETLLNQKNVKSVSN